MIKVEIANASMCDTQRARVEELISKIDNKDISAQNALEELLTIGAQPHAEGCKGSYFCSCGKALFKRWSQSHMVITCSCIGWNENLALTFDDQDARNQDWDKCPFCEKAFEIKI